MKTEECMDNRASVQWNPFIRNSFKMKLELVLKMHWSGCTTAWNPFIRNYFKMKLDLVLKIQCSSWTTGAQYSGTLS